MVEEREWVEAQIPEKLGYYFERGKWRYKGSRGGRGGMKSRTISSALAIRGAEEPIRWLCARETQISLKFSSKQLIEDAIQRHQLQASYTIVEDEIRGTQVFEVLDPDSGVIMERRTVFIFRGLRELSDAKSADAIKSLEDFDGVWIAEAHNVSEGSWNKVTPSFRRKPTKWRVKGTKEWNTGSGSEIWFDYNPELEEDFIHRWSNDPPPNAKVVDVSYLDNPWLPDDLRIDAEHMKRTDPEGYEHIWLGKALNSVKGAVYGKEMAAAYETGRIVLDPGIGVDRTRPVDVFFDLGHGDPMALWFAQSAAGWFNVLDFYQNKNEAIEHYAAVIRERGYPLGTLWLPWDGVDAQLHHRLTGSNQRSPEMALRSLGFTVRIAAKTGIDVGISSVRTIFPQLRFSEPKCHEGIRSLRAYQWGAKPDKDGNILSKAGTVITKPLHDPHSHAADALRTLAACIKQPSYAPPAGKPMRQGPSGPEAWMA